MKRLWVHIALAIFVSIAPIPEKGWAQSSSGETVTVEWIWPDSLRGEDINIFSIVVNDSGHIFVGTTGDWDGHNAYVYRSKDTGRTWVQLKNGLEGNISFGDVYTLAVVGSGYLLAGTWDGIFKSTDNGEFWRKIDVPVGRSRQFFRAPDGNIYVACAERSIGVWRSSDNGETWQPKSNGITASVVETITMTPSGTLFAGTGHADGGEGVFRSTDNGENWVPANNGLDNGMPGAYSSLNIWRLAACHSGFSGTVFATTAYAGVYRTGDEGDNWYRVENLPVNWGGAVAIYTAGIFVGNGSSSGGLYRSISGINWELVGLRTYIILSFAQLSPSKLLVGTHDGVFLVTFGTTPVEPYSLLPTHYSLSQNYPNPFNPTTTIEFSLPERSFVTLKVMNILGQEIELVGAEVKEAGNHHFVWNALRYSSGIYLYRLETKSFSATKRMVLIK